ncbi:MAG: hypothetical protein MRQ07_01035, partial [Candidatus Midichloria sp.]|nr:hypothetical protein [Candidatus Midichloria sp.]
NINILEIITSEREFEAKLKPDGKVLFLLGATATHYEKIKSSRRILLKISWNYLSKYEERFFNY